MFFSLISIRHFEGAWETGSVLCPIALWDYFDCFFDTRHVDWDGCIAGAPLHADVQSGGGGGGPQQKKVLEGGGGGGGGGAPNITKF